MSGVVLSITATIASLILIYLLVSNPNAVVSIAQTTGGFVTTESRVLQGR